MFVFSEILACFAFLKPPFLDSPFCLIPDEKLSSLVEIILAETVLSFRAKIITGKFNNIKNKMADKTKLETMEIPIELQNNATNFYFAKTVKNCYCRAT